jgi:bis(5'-nucleosidyl)-tetraphosphatase
VREVVSAGIVVFIKENSEIKYLLLHYSHGHWDFVKGKLEEGEIEQEAAIRELQEETGLHAHIMQDFESSISYHYTEADGIPAHKTVYFFVGEAYSTEVKLSDEHVGYDWLTYDQALERLTFDNAKEVLRKADKFIRTK